MSTIRQNKVSRLVQREMGDLFQKEGKHLFPGGLVTVTGVEMSPDLSIAKIFMTFLNLKPQETIEMLMNKRSEIRNYLSPRVKNQLRIVPDLRFHIDDSYDAIQRIEQLLKK
ncbi:MAG TPA: 30S ribosome-binding factor RbfA [Bacteroidia bacterium]|jgi:ribosome-binding factor A|nr:30S ribosome-binding factor RbfA [Bacteroidia bacterium]